MGAGIDRDTLVVASGVYGYGGRWLASRLAVRLVLEPDATHLVGAADALPDSWAHDSRGPREAARAYDDCAAPMCRASPRPALAATLVEVDRVFAEAHAAGQRDLAAGCTAVRLDGPVLRGAHVGEGCVLVLRADEAGAERLVAPHHLHVPENPTLRILANSLRAHSGELRVDAFTVDLRAGICSSSPPRTCPRRRRDRRARRRVARTSGAARAACGGHRGAPRCASRMSPDLLRAGSTAVTSASEGHHPAPALEPGQGLRSFPARTRSARSPPSPRRARANSHHSSVTRAVLCSPELRLCLFSLK